MKFKELFSVINSHFVVSDCTNKMLWNSFTMGKNIPTEISEKVISSITVNSNMMFGEVISIIVK